MTTSGEATTEHVEGRNGTFAYRRFGRHGATPLVLLNRFRGTLDHWDPAFVDVLASERDVILFDNLGTSRSSGTTPRTIQGHAEGAAEFIDALGETTVDALGWSLGGFVAQFLALGRPDLIRRLVVAGSGPGAVPDLPPTPERVWEVGMSPTETDDGYLYLFYPDTEPARAAGIASLRRLDPRLDEKAKLSAAQLQAQGEALMTLGSGSWDRLNELTLPVLVANGAHDVMVPAFASYAMSQRLPNAKIVLYSDAGHAFLFQHAAEFGKEILDFLR